MNRSCVRSVWFAAGIVLFTTGCATVAPVEQPPSAPSSVVTVPLSVESSVSSVSLPSSVSSEETAETSVAEESAADTKTEAPQVSQPPVTTPAAPTTSGWKTYTSSSFGFSVQFPSDWSVIESTPSAARKATRIMSSDPSTYGDIVIELEGRSLDEIRDDSLVGPDVSEKPITIGNASGLQFRRETSSETYVQVGGNVFSVRASRFQNATVQRVLASIRF